MARVTKTRKPETLPATQLEAMMRDHLHALAVQNYSAHTVTQSPGPHRLLPSVVQGARA